jgi:hypothetical protein
MSACMYWHLVVKRSLPLFILRKRVPFHRRLSPSHSKQYLHGTSMAPVNTIIGRNDILIVVAYAGENNMVSVNHEVLIFLLPILAAS